MAIKNFVEELEWRGMIHSIMPGTQEQLQKEMSTAYVGIDPTADSLHIGHLVSVMILKHFQMCGHRPIALVGGATGMIGDPSGKSQERNLLDEATLRPAPKIFKEDCRIDWEKPGREIVNFVRGLSPYPAAWTEMYREGDGEASSAKIFSASFEAAVHGEACGTLQSDGRTFIRVACADGWIALGELQIAGKKRLAVRELLLGWRDVQQCRFRE